MSRCFFNKGFTIIELLITVGVVGILSGIVITVINPTTQRNRARDAVRSSNASKIAQAAEAFNAAEGRYPADQAELQNSNYIKNWPTETDVTYDYFINTEVNFSTVCITVPMASMAGRYFKYLSACHWAYTGGCPDPDGVYFNGKIMRNCSNRCGTGPQDNDLNNCLL
ncbi:hypothetical protein A2716_00200 [candidate division WWE3 bacterium RIFCSPHIGHO2_01_FULL_40_23]|uniref:Type II secretion system protein GspG C-terminal domain-containing protein n=1 Tax=candidate division WWE3 bacterium RIFCSPLOWO2_01_FULL_41_18 TaxID=1802625 RepID=A0A1F4VEM1_UNCKA|nr:MAG: hypothetical protein A2716_00200 [candidate division WWE3 bacterium RIFCSPHIGHO2_01_FULL_40_23]OGC55418.1 MAG: hypothetical protein A3A78_00470 [candidate division WWE3 bacterium RIFCSPLOWO2_01_FULL_41_18]